MEKKYVRDCAIGTSCFLAALPILGQSALPPASPPLSTIPQVTTPRPSQPALTSQLELSRQLQTQQPGQRRVQIRQIAISGVKSLPFEQIADFFKPFSGKEASLDQLGNAAAQATALYRQSGYPLSFVYLPEQSFQNGLVQVIAVEGHIAQVNIEGDPGKSEKLLREMAQPLIDNKPLDQANFDKQTLLLSRLETLKIVANAGMPQTTDGAVPLVLKLDRKPAIFNVGAELKQSDSKGIANLTLNDPFWGGSQLQVSGLLQKPDKERYVSVALRQWLNAQGTQMRLSYSDFKGTENFSQGFTLQNLTYQKRAEIALTHPWKLTRNEHIAVGASLLGIDYEKNYLYPEINLNIADGEKVRALQVQANWLKFSTQSVQSAHVMITQGINSLGAGSSRKNNFNAPMVENPAKFDFFRMAFDYSLRYRFENKLGTAAAIGGQYSPDSLPTTERTSFGGSRYGRGYRTGEASGDRGLGASIELNYFLAFPQGKWLKNVEPYIFHEQARTWFESSIFTGQHLKSTGIGLRFGDNQYYSLDFAVAKPHGDPSPYNPDRKLRYMLTLSYQLDI